MSDVPTQLYVVMAGDQPFYGGGSSSPAYIRAFMVLDSAKRSLKAAQRQTASYERATHVAVFELKEVVE